MSYFKKKVQEYTDNYFTYNAEYKKTPMRNFSCLIFRHDMDAINEELFCRFIDKEKGSGSQASLFFRVVQFKKLKEAIKRIDRKQYEIGLHSEANPWLIPSRPEFAKVIEIMYRNKLQKQFKEAAFFSGLSLSGHSPHAFHNYLPFKSMMSWMIIEKASLGVVDYLSDWKIPSRVPQGQDFPFCYEAPYRVEIRASSMAVFQTCWDDKFFFTPEECESLGIKKDKRSLEDGFESVKRHIDNCVRRNHPMVINLHPYLWFEDDSYLQFKCLLRDYCQANKIQIMNFREYLRRVDL